MVLALTRPPVAPSTLRPETFAEEMDDRLAWQDVNVDEMNQVLPLVEGAAGAGASAAASAAAAAISAASALAAPGTNATSNTPLTVSAGVLAITIQANKDIVPGGWLMCARTADPDGVWMLGQIRSYTKATGALALAVAAGDTKGAGTYSDWTLSLSSARSTVFNAVDLSLVGPSIRPSLLFDFANSKRLDPRLVYTMASPQTYFDAMGVMRTAAAGVPAFDHDPVTGESLGIQMFEARTNLLLRSEEFDNAAWATGGALPIVPNSAMAPTGVMAMDKLVESTATSQHHLAQDFAAQPAATYAFSTHVLPAGRTMIMLLQASGSGHSVVFDLVAMTATSDLGGATGKITRLASGIFRLEMVFTTVSSQTLSMRKLLMNGVTSTYAGDGVSGAYFWGAQLEAGGFVSPYIPTTSATVTRTAPQLYINTDSAWFNAREGTLYGAIVSSPSAGNQNKMAAAFYGGIAGNYIYVGQRTGGGTVAEIVASSALQINVQDSVTSKTLAAALAYKANDSAASLNGAAAVVDTSVTLPTVDTLYIGSLAASNIANGRISKLAYWPRRLPDVELTALTTQ